MSRSRSDHSKWRFAVLALYGEWCAAAEEGGCEGVIEAHHLQYRSQGGKDVALNGLPLCTIHHMKVHSRTVKIRRHWLLAEAVEYLAERGEVTWDEDGLPSGRAWKGFAALS